ncbi:hypothetical protein CEUSTIGMA_g5407.t1 [Chlamydomonas eustigma]|uniref:Uncharacterized protein n=1 Tax=Chlamydomonas eustigma TaxID=1157962 RepID=A0A250X4G4_9CHLO|nr:hypothetical protein CEUSTIGMA_g5407.t1 [Chlamydomonas eustigma]|eukprot:GAX77965.1 hypothetical protein CEUSTIGMA_g5407.t1 [Chlamydomonas eustigma]
MKESSVGLTTAVDHLRRRRLESEVVIETVGTSSSAARGLFNARHQQYKRWYTIGQSCQYAFNNWDQFILNPSDLQKLRKQLRSISLIPHHEKDHKKDSNPVDLHIQTAHGLSSEIGRLRLRHADDDLLHQPSRMERSARNSESSVQDYAPEESLPRHVHHDETKDVHSQHSDVDYPYDPYHYAIEGGAHKALQGCSETSTCQDVQKTVIDPGSTLEDGSPAATGVPVLSYAIRSCHEAGPEPDSTQRFEKQGAVTSTSHSHHSLRASSHFKDDQWREKDQDDSNHPQGHNSIDRPLPLLCISTGLTRIKEDVQLRPSAFHLLAVASKSKAVSLISDAPIEPEKDPRHLPDTNIQPANLLFGTTQHNEPVLNHEQHVQYCSAPSYLQSTLHGYEHGYEHTTHVDFSIVLPTASLDHLLLEDDTNCLTQSLPSCIFSTCCEMDGNGCEVTSRSCEEAEHNAGSNHCDSSQDEINASSAFQTPGSALDNNDGDYLPGFCFSATSHSTSSLLRSHDSNNLSNGSSEQVAMRDAAFKREACSSGSSRSAGGAVALHKWPSTLSAGGAEQDEGRKHDVVATSCPCDDEDDEGKAPVLLTSCTAVVLPVLPGHMDLGAFAGPHGDLLIPRNLRPHGLVPHSSVKSEDNSGWLNESWVKRWQYGCSVQ